MLKGQSVRFHTVRETDLDQRDKGIATEGVNLLVGYLFETKRVR
jgi:hypothetical protein